MEKTQLNIKNGFELRMKSYLLDTNFLIALDNSKSEYHKKAVNLFQSIDNSLIFIPAIVVAEFLVGFEKVNVGLRICNEISSTDFLQVENQDLEFLNKISLKTRKKLKANDSLVIALAKRYNAKLYSFDNIIQQIAIKLDIKTFHD